MCGISGYFLGSNTCVNFKPDLHRSLELISHRGPDDKDIYLSNDKTLGLAHSRLSIIDLSQNGHQPMHSSDQRLTIVFNGEIYNYKELRNFLYQNGFKKWNGSSDTEVVLKMFLYAFKNEINIEKVLSRLQGIFAIALWNSKDKELFLIRDALGVKPLYFSEMNKGVYFSSEIKSILPLIGNCSLSDEDGFENFIDAENINRYLTFLWCPGNGTPSKILASF